MLRIAIKRAGITPQILLTAKSKVFTLKILLIASKPTGHLVPRCRNNFQLWSQPKKVVVVVGFVVTIVVVDERERERERYLF